MEEVAMVTAYAWGKGDGAGRGGGAGAGEGKLAAMKGKSSRTFQRD